MIKIIKIKNGQQTVKQTEKGNNGLSPNFYAVAKKLGFKKLDPSKYPQKVK